MGTISKKYKECMNFMVYEKVGEGICEKPMRVLRAQFDKEDDAKIFIDAKTKKENRKYQLLKNDGWHVLEMD